MKVFVTAENIKYTVQKIKDVVQNCHTCTDKIHIKTLRLYIGNKYVGHKSICDS